MNSLNRVTLIGNLGKDPEIRYLENNIPVARFSVATTDRYRDKDGNYQDRPTEWHDVVAWRYLAEKAQKELKKGASVYVEGAINYRKYEDQQGNTRYYTQIVARSFRVFERRESSGSFSGGFPTTADDPLANKSQVSNSPSPNPKPTPPTTHTPVVTNKPTPPKTPVSKEEVDEFGDDLPF